MKAIPLLFQPVLLTNVVKTKLADSCEGAFDGTATMITRKEMIDVHSVKSVRAGRVLL